MDAICNSYNSMPKICTYYGYDATSALGASTGLSTSTIVLIVIVIVILNIILILSCRIYANRKLQSRIASSMLEDKITSTVSNYMALRDK